MTPFQAGYDCGKNGPNNANCNFSIFSSQERTREWESGKAKADAEKGTAIPAQETKRS